MLTSCALEYGEGILLFGPLPPRQCGYVLDHQVKSSSSIADVQQVIKGQWPSKWSWKLAIFMCRCGGGSRRRWWARQMGTNASRIFFYELYVVPLSGFGSHQRTVLCCLVLHSSSALSAILSWPGTSGSLLQPSNLPYRHLEVISIRELTAGTVHAS